MDYCEINRQLEYLIIIVETVTSPQWLARVGQSPKCPFTLQNSQFPVLSPGNEILLSLPPVIINVCCPGKEGEREGGSGSPTAHLWLVPSPHTRPALPALSACSLGGKISWLGAERETGEAITHPTFLCSMPPSISPHCTVEEGKIARLKTCVLLLPFTILFVNKTTFC